MLDMEKIKAFGRGKYENGALEVDWTCAGIEFRAVCEGDIFITMHTNSAQKLYFSAFVDGTKNRLCVQDFFGDTEGEFTLKIAAGLENGEHSVKFIRQSEAERGCAEISGITLNGTLLPRPADGEKLIEFLGDSITCGYANLATCDMEPDYCSQSVCEDGTAGYAFLTAEALGFDYSMISRQGTGIVAGWDYLTNPMGAIPKVYALRSFYRGNENYEPKRKADIMVINLGTNDVYKFLSDEHEPTLSEDDFIKTIYKVLCDIYDFNHGPMMIIAVGMMSNEQNHAPLYRWYREAISRFERDRGSRILFCHLPENYDGGKAHPSVEGHCAAAETLISFIKENL